MAKSKDTGNKSLKDTLADIDSHFGKGTVMRMGDREILDIPSISTGSVGLDIALGIGGIPKGRVTEIYGPESSGKTTLTLQIIAQCQKDGGTCAFIDAEHALDPQYAEKLGVNVDELLLSQPDTGEQALEVADMLRSAENESIIDADALQIMEGALKVSDLQAREIMIPRSQMKFVDVNASLEEILKVVVQSQHSRFPVVGESSDDIQGILLAKELLPLVLSGKDAFDLKNMLRPATVIPESKRLNVLLQEFREQRYHMAIVIDEYGGVSGLLTIEDVLEEIVGEIEDETDEYEPEQIRRLAENCFSIDAVTDIADFNEFWTEF
mgnify:CR=1 FL=1